MNPTKCDYYQVELVVKPGPGLCDGSGVGEHADSSWDLGKISAGDNSWWLVIDANLEASGAPVHKLDASLGLDGCNGSIDILGDNISTVEEAAGHVLPMPGITLNHLVGRLKAGIGDLSHSKLLMVSLLRGDDRCIGDQWEVDPGIGNQVGLELCQIHIEGSIKAKGGSDGGHYLTNETVEVGISWPLNIQVPAADVIDGLIVNHECTIRVLQSGVGGQDGIVGFNHSSGNLGSWVDGELQLRLLAIVNREPLHEQRSEARSSATSKRVEEKEALQASALVSQLPNPVQNKVNHLRANGVVAPGIVVGSILLAVDELLRMEELAVGSTPGLIYDSGLQINEDSSGDMLPSTSLREEGGEGVIPKSLVRRHVAIRLNAMLQAVELPAGIANLATGLANVDGDALTLEKKI